MILSGPTLGYTCIEVMATLRPCLRQEVGWCSAPYNFIEIMTIEGDVVLQLFVGHEGGPSLNDGCFTYMIAITLRGFFVPMSFATRPAWTTEPKTTQTWLKLL